MEELRFNSTYYFADLIEYYIYSETGFWNYSKEIFIERSISFKKETLLHHYIETYIWNHFIRIIRKDGGDYIDNIFFFKSLMETYGVDSILFKNIGIDEESTDELILKKINDDFLNKWFKYEKEFRDLFNKIADDVFYIYISVIEIYYFILIKLFLKR